jgi:hypothetical protein
MFTRTEDKIINTFYEIRFIDTFAFMASSIEKLSENLRIESALKIGVDVNIKNDKQTYKIMNIQDNNNILVKNKDTSLIIKVDDI